VLISDTDGVYEKDKERLANMMAYGEDIAPASGETSGKVFLRRPEKEEDESDEEIDRFQECKIRPCSCEHRPNSFFWSWYKLRMNQSGLSTATAGPGKHSHEAPNIFTGALWGENFLNFSFQNGTFWCTLYFWPTAGAPQTS